MNIGATGTFFFDKITATNPFPAPHEKLKTWNTVPVANIKTINTVAIANVKTTNTA